MIPTLFRSALAGVIVSLAATAPAWSFEPPTTAEFLGRFSVPEEVTIRVEDDGSVLVSAPPGYQGYVSMTFRDDELPAPGSREVSIDITMIKDGGGWPDNLVGIGLTHGLREGEPGTPFSLAVVSPQDGGTLRSGSYTGDGFSIGQAIGSGNMGLGQTVRLTIREDGGSLVYRVESGSGSTSETSVANDLVTAGMQPGPRIGIILVSGGTYRIDNLSIESSQ